MIGKIKCQVGPSMKYRSGEIVIKKADEIHSKPKKNANSQQTTEGNNKTKNLSPGVF
jgi:hypothetical protein